MLGQRPFGGGQLRFRAVRPERFGEIVAGDRELVSHYELADLRERERVASAFQSLGAQGEFAGELQRLVGRPTP